MKQRILSYLLLMVALVTGSTGAWADTDTTYTFEDASDLLFSGKGNAGDGRISITQKYVEAISSNVVDFKCAGNAQNGYSFAYYQFPSLTQDYQKVTISFKCYLTSGGRGIITLGDADVRGVTGNSGKNTYNPKGALFRIGSDRNNAYLNGNTKLALATYTNKWLNVSVSFNLSDGTMSYTIDELGGSQIASESDIAYYQSDAIACTQIDVFGYINNSDMIMIDDLRITAKEKAVTAGYTVKYVDTNGNELKAAATARTGIVGKTVSLLPADKEAIYAADGSKKYIYQSDNAASTTIASDGSSVVTVVFREATSYSYTVNAIDESSSVIAPIASGTVFEGDNATVAYKRYLVQNGKLLEADKIDDSKKAYKYTFAVNSDNMVATVTYKATSTTDVVYLTEAEDLEGATVFDTGNPSARASNSKTGYAATEDLKLTSLSAGKYKLGVGVFDTTKDGKGASFFITNGEESIFNAKANGVNLSEAKSDEIIIAKATDVYLQAGGGGNYSVDYIYIQRTGDLDPAKGVLDFTTFSELPYCVNDKDATGNITADKTLDGGQFSATISPKASGSTENRFYLYNGTIEARVYNGTMTVTAQPGYLLKNIEFIQNSTTWTAPTVDNGSLSGKVWTNDEGVGEVTFTFSKQCRFTALNVGMAPLPVKNTIADFKKSSVGTLFLNGAEVLYAQGKDIYVQDQTGGIDLYNINISDAAADKVLSGSLPGKYTLYSSKTPEVQFLSGYTNNHNVTAKDGQATAYELSVADALKTDNALRLALLKKVKISVDGEKIYATDANGDKIQVVDKLGVGYELNDGDELVSITGITFVDAVDANVLVPRSEKDILNGSLWTSTDEAGDDISTPIDLTDDSTIAKFEDLAAGDVIIVEVANATAPATVTATTKDGQDILTLEVSAAGEVEIPVTVDVIENLKGNGLIIKGTGVTATSARMEAEAYPDFTEQDIWLGRVTTDGQFTLGNAHFADVKANDTIRIEKVATLVINNEEIALPTAEGDNYVVLTAATAAQLASNGLVVKTIAGGTLVSVALVPEDIVSADLAEYLAIEDEELRSRTHLGFEEAYITATDKYGAFMQQGEKGLYLYDTDYSKIRPNTAISGKLVGEYAVVDGMPQFTPTRYYIEVQDATVAPLEVEVAEAQNYLSMLVKTGYGKLLQENGKKFVVNGDAKLEIADRFEVLLGEGYTLPENIASITGIVTVANGQYQINPLSKQDIVEGTAPTNELTYTLVKTLDFTTETYAENPVLATGDKVGTAYETGNARQQDIYVATAPAEIAGDIAFQALYDVVNASGKGWWLRADAGGLFTYQAPRSAAVLNQKTGNRVVFYTTQKANNVMTLTNADGASDGPFVYELGEDSLSYVVTMIGDGNVGFCGVRDQGYISKIEIYEPDGEVTVTDYTVKYVDEAGAELKDAATRQTIAGMAPIVLNSDKADIVKNGLTYLYKSDDAEGQKVAADGSTVVNVTFELAASDLKYTVQETVNGAVVYETTGNDSQGASVKVPYHKYNLVDGTLYSKGVTNKQYNYTFTLKENNQVEKLAYAATDKTNVVFLTEGEDIEGASVSEHANVLIRASKSASGYATEDLEVVTLAAGTYKMVVGCFDTAKAGNTAVFTFATADQELFSITSNGNNLSEVASDEFTLNATTTIILKAGGDQTKSIDYLYITSDNGSVVESKASVKLVHTASSYCGADANAYTSTVDAEKEHINNNRFSSTWQGAAYAEFAVKVPANLNVTKATLAFTGYGESRSATRNVDVMYANAGEALDYEALSAGNAKVNLAATTISSVGFKSTAVVESERFEVDVTEALGTILEAGQQYIIFKWTNNPGGGDVAGKASAEAPTLTIETEAVEELLFDETYALAEGEAHASGESVTVKHEGEDIATLTFGEAGGADFNAAAADTQVEGFTAFTSGNGENGNKTGGTFYVIEPKYDGKVDVAVVLNADKAFYVLEDGTALPDYNGIKVSEKFYGTYTFDVKGGSTYKVYCAGSKLGFYGFNYYNTGVHTGIESLQAEQPRTANYGNGVYNMNGQKVGDTLEGLRKGLYILNGRKVVVK